MKRISLALIFFYCCTFCAPRPAIAAVPVLIAAGAIGAAMIATSAGQYYAKNGTYPSYVSATAGAIASASDYLFQPAYLAAGPFTLISAASFPASATYYIAKDASLGMSLSNIYDIVTNSAVGLYSNLKSLFSSNTSSPSYPIFPNGSVVSLNGQMRQIIRSGWGGE